MPRSNLLLRGLLISLVPVLLAGECCDGDLSCETVCAKLVQCEQEWLTDSHKSAMSSGEQEEYLEDCVVDCEAHEDFESCCLDGSSCEQIRQGECSR